MSVSSAGSPSPPPLTSIHTSTATVDEAGLPKGRCRYILTMPELKGHRCGCTHFSLNRSTPSASCDCGHLACFHVKTDENIVDKGELEQTKARLDCLEEQLDREINGGLGSVVSRVSEAEDLVEKLREDVGQDHKELYRNITGVWQYVDQEKETRTKEILALEDKLRLHGERFTALEKQLRSLGERQLEMSDAEWILEERISNLEDCSSPIAKSPITLDNPRGIDPAVSWSFASEGAFIPSATGDQKRRRARRNKPDTVTVRRAPTRTQLTTVPLRDPPQYASSSSWTAHVSLLPDRSQPFPFEKDTNAYKRCLSRGLHQMIVVAGPDADAVSRAISEAFSPLLKGRPWMPLQAKLCDAEQLEGLPMLRQLEPNLRDSKYDLAFLREHCAVCSPSGKIDSFYIAMQQDTFSWHFLKNSPVHKEGLEECWVFDKFLDLNETVDDDLELDDECYPSAGGIVVGLPLKRAASEISRSSTIPPTEPEGSRKRAQLLPGLIDLRRRTETV